MPVLAKNLKKDETERKQIESILYKDGKEIIKYVDEPLIPDELPEAEQSISFSTTPLASRAVAPYYRSTLQPVNSYSYVWAFSECTNRTINKMTVSCSGYRDIGNYIAEDRQSSPAGWEVGSYSAYVKPLDIGLKK